MEESATNATENCEFVWTGNLSLNLATFYSCINSYVISNCNQFKDHIPGCDLLEEHLTKCGKIAVNCSQWPKEDNEDNLCCQSPKIIKTEILATCIDACKEKEYFHVLMQKCFSDCIIRETKVINDGKIDIETVKKVLIENANKTVDWEKHVEAAVEKCEKISKGLSVT